MKDLIIYVDVES